MATPDTYSGVVAANVRRLRKERGWTLRDLSERLDAAGWRLGLQTLSKLENERREVGVNDLVAFERVFAVPLDQLLAGDIPPGLSSLIDRWREANSEAEASEQLVEVYADRLKDAEYQLELAVYDRDQLDASIVGTLEELGIERSAFLDSVTRRYGVELGEQLAQRLREV